MKPLLEKMINAEIDEHLGYIKYEKNSSDNSRNGYLAKTIKGLFGSTKSNTPRDRNATFKPIIIQKNNSNIAGIEEVIILMYAKGNLTRDIDEHIKEIYKPSLI